MNRTIANQSLYANAMTGFHAAFMEGLEASGPDPLMILAMETTSTGSSEEYIFIGDLPGFEEWKDDRKMGSLAAHRIRVTNKDWANGVPVHRNEIADDKLGIVGKRIAGLAQKAARHKGDLLTKLLLNGFTGTAYPDTGDGLCYTGDLFFSDSHQLEGNSTTIDNLATDALSVTSLEARVKQMREFTTWDGADPLDVTPTHLFVGPKLEFTAKRIVGQQVTVETAGDGGVTNIHYGAFTVVVLPRLIGTYDDYWFLADLSKPIKPLIVQDREPITTSAQTDWNSKDLFQKGVMNFGAQARYNAGYFDPRLIIGSAV